MRRHRTNIIIAILIMILVLIQLYENGELLSTRVIDPLLLNQKFHKSSISTLVNGTNCGRLLQSLKALYSPYLDHEVYKSVNTIINYIVNNTNCGVIKSNSHHGRVHSYNFSKLSPVFYLYDEANYFFIDINRGTTCFVEGTDLQKSERKCICKAEYFGDDCGIPAAAWFSFYQNKGSLVQLRRRATPRRVIHGFHMLHEFDMFEARVHELYNTVDVFVIAEANHTDYGDPKPLLFLNRLKNGYMSEYQDKIIHLFIDSKPPNAKENNWKAHNYMRSFLGPASLSFINGIRDDDLFIVTDADEIPTHEIVTFLKLYDGYYEHVCFRYRWNVYGFFWKPQKKRMTEVCSVSSINILREKFGNNTLNIRANTVMRTWWAGTMNHFAGWHCSWCLSPEDIVIKLESAQGADRPRWGDFPEKKNITYIQRLIHEGRWFNDKEHFVPAQIYEPMYAPSYLMENYAKYKKILYNT